MAEARGSASPTCGSGDCRKFGQPLDRTFSVDRYGPDPCARDVLPAQAASSRSTANDTEYLIPAEKDANNRPLTDEDNYLQPTSVQPTYLAIVDSPSGQLDQSLNYLSSPVGVDCTTHSLCLCNFILVSHTLTVGFLSWNMLKSRTRGTVWLPQATVSSLYMT